MKMMEFDYLLSNRGMFNPMPVGLKLVGLYFLFKGDALVYIGKSAHISVRINAHLKNKDFDSFHIKEYFDESYHADELLYINKFSPPLNRSLVNNSNWRASSGNVTDRCLYSEIVRIIKSKRLLLKMSQAEVAEKIGVTVVYYSNIERGKTSLSIKILELIFNALSLTVKII